jgi:gliding motility-associated-like protein
VVTVDQKITPTFTLGASASICAGDPVATLPNTSTNGITGAWTPAVVSNTTSGTYTFTPAAGQCATTTTYSVTVNPIVAPAFTFGASASVCEGDPVATLPNTSTNGITGAWSPTVVSNTTSGTYTFTPAAGQCATPATYTVTVIPKITPTFNFGATLTICSGEPVPVLPATSTNGITGTWTPGVVSNTATGSYTFTSTSSPCAPPVTFMVTVNQKITPRFAFGSNGSVCIGDSVPTLTDTSLNAIPGTWNPAVVSKTTSGTYTFTPAAGQCANTFNFTWQVNAVPAITNILKDTAVYDGAVVPPYNFTINEPGGDIKWKNSNTSIGLAASGAGTVPSFTAINITDDPRIAVITATPFMNGCTGASQSYKITVLPLHKDVFVPNIFSPNGDTYNDQLFIYGNYIASVEMQIFNQWGQRLITITNQHEGWDGKFKGSGQPVGVYMYVLKAVLTNGRKVNMKGSVTLIR